MKRNDLILLLVLLAGAAGFALYARTPAASASAAVSGEPELIAATFNSQWCSACKILKPRLLKVMHDFADAPVKFVEYDLTFGPDRPRAAAAADGLASVYERFSTATGYTLLIDAQTGAIVDRLTVNHSAADMRRIIAARLAEASE
jgi:thiol-disulfide isomerase/thioredoxin